MNSFLKGSKTILGDIELSSISSEDILGYMPKITDGTKQSTKKLRFSLLPAFFNFIRNSLNTNEIRKVAGKQNWRFYPRKLQTVLMTHQGNFYHESTLKCS